MTLEFTRTCCGGEDLFGRHLDLAPLRGRRRGRVRCIFHRERTPSLSVDLDRGLFHCFGCGEHGGIVRFAELVGERQSTACATPPWEPPLDRARREVLALARKQPWCREETRLLYQISDAIRRRHRAVALARDVATRAGDCEPSWDLLATTAAVEIETEAIEAELVACA